jgi:hypothetical protein
MRSPACNAVCQLAAPWCKPWAREAEILIAEGGAQGDEYGGPDPADMRE